MDGDETAEAPDTIGENSRPGEVPSILASVGATVLELLAGLPQPPSVLRIRSGETSIEVEWSSSGGNPEAGQATPGPPRPTTAVVETPERDAADQESPTSTSYLRAPTVGSFFRAPGPDAKSFVEVGETVAVGQQVGIVETMKLMIPVTAEMAGEIVEVLKENGDPVQYDEPLFALALSTT